LAPQVPPVQKYDEAAGLQFAVSVEVPPAFTAVGIATMVQIGVAETVTVATPLAAPVPVTLTPATVYEVVAVGLTVQVAVVFVAHAPPVQTNDVAAGVQEDVNVDDPPEATVAGDALKVQFGKGIVTVTVAPTLGVPVPPAFTPATV
jgi:hypothetical protein